ncbi:methyltransferase, putative [Babesia caballi]|uniref:Methyltransferase, putative n=1 Tax=Babesia caballi TaxID=5871 RepID=A0AAV4LUW9_BABCB|nr:methyltransferase, putative [Babesia caballi]
MDQDTEDDSVDFNEEWLYCLRANELKDAVQLLKERLVTNISVVDVNGNGPLHYCCANNLPEAVVFLLQECKVDYCRPNRSGNTPLQWAVQTNSTEAVKQLLLHDYHVHSADYQSLERSDYFDTLEPCTLRDEFKLDDATKLHYNIADYPSTYADDNRLSIVTPNCFGKTILNDAFSARDENILHAILEHPAAAVLDQPAETSQPELPIERVTVHGVSGVVHTLQFSGADEATNQRQIKVRELEIKHEEILNSSSAEQDHTGQVIWETDIVCAHWVTALAGEGAFAGKRVLQLGSGCGLSGIALYVAAASSGKAPRALMFTDVCQETMRNLQFNVELNKLNSVDGVSVRTLDWTKPETWPRDAQGDLLAFDVVVGSDLVYDTNLVEPLTNVIQSLLGQAQGELFYAFRRTRSGSELVSAAHTRLRCADAAAAQEFQANPLTSGNDQVLQLFFPDLLADDYTILHARRLQTYTSDAQ